MRDLVVRDALEQLAFEAGERFAELIEDGAEIPFEVAEQPGEHSPLYRYAAQTTGFVREHAATLRELEIYGAARESVIQAGIAAPYLEHAGIPAPDDRGRQAEELLVAFVCRTFEESVDFAVDPQRVQAAIREIEHGAERADGPIEVAVPIVGLKLPVGRVRFAGVTLVRADTVEVPQEMYEADGLTRSDWRHQFLAVTTCEDDGPGVASGAHRDFKNLITALRLYGPGGVGLGPHAWMRAGEGRWRRLSTGAARPRPGGYEIGEEELPELAAFARAVATRPGRRDPFGWAIARFEMGCERRSALQALSDNLLCLRALLEGGGPADVGLAMRVAALCAEPEARMAAKATVLRAQTLERDLMTGSRVDAPSDEERSPIEIVAEIEESTRAILKDAVAGHLGGDLRATADEILLADGLSIGEGAVGARGETSEWSPPPAGWEEAPEDIDPDEEEHEMEVADGAPEHDGSGTDLPDWLSEADPGEGTLEWPAVTRMRDREHAAAEQGDISARVRHLFPAPETTEWSIGELGNFGKQH